LKVFDSVNYYFDNLLNTNSAADIDQFSLSGADSRNPERTLGLVKLPSLPRTYAA